MVSSKCSLGVALSGLASGEAARRLATVVLLLAPEETRCFRPVPRASRGLVALSLAGGTARGLRIICEHVRAGASTMGVSYFVLNLHESTTVPSTRSTIMASSIKRIMGVNADISRLVRDQVIAQTCDF